MTETHDSMSFEDNAGIGTLATALAAGDKGLFEGEPCAGDPLA